MQFKEPEYKEQYERICPMLRLIAQEFEKMSLSFGIEPTCTRIIGSLAGDSGVHAVGRGMDFRDETNSGFIYTDSQRIDIMAHINTLFPRSDKLFSIKYHSFQGSPYHFHIQVPPFIGILHGMIFNIYPVDEPSAA